MAMAGVDINEVEVSSLDEFNFVDFLFWFLFHLLIISIALDAARFGHDVLNGICFVFVGCTRSRTTCTGYHSHHCLPKTNQHAESYYAEGYTGSSHECVVALIWPSYHCHCR